MPLLGLEYVPVFLVKPQPLTVDSVTDAGIVGLSVKSLYEPLVATVASEDLSALPLTS